MIHMRWQKDKVFLVPVFCSVNCSVTGIASCPINPLQHATSAIQPVLRLFFVNVPTPDIHQKVALLLCLNKRTALRSEGPFGAASISVKQGSRFGRMIVHRLGMALDCLVLDLDLAQPIAIGVDALLGGLAVQPHLIVLRHFGHTQALRQDCLDEGLVRQAVGEAHQHMGALLRKGI